MDGHGYLVVDAIEEAWHGHKHSRSQLLNIVHQQLDVAAIETNPSTTHEHHTLCDVIRHVDDVIQHVDDVILHNVVYVLGQPSPSCEQEVDKKCVHHQDWGPPGVPRGEGA